MRYEGRPKKKQNKKQNKTKFLYILGYLLEVIIKIWGFEKIKSSKFGEFGSFFP
jgi:hypothetical protein